MEETIFVSGCLLGINCRYDGGNCRRQKMIDLARSKKIVAVCGEQMGGMTTPRRPSERVADKVLSIDGSDVSKNYFGGANEILTLARELGVKRAYLKSESPMCGQGLIFDGTFTGKLVPGDGVLTELLKKNGIEVISVD